MGVVFGAAAFLSLVAAVPLDSNPGSPGVAGVPAAFRTVSGAAYLPSHLTGQTMERPGPGVGGGGGGGAGGGAGALRAPPPAGGGGAAGAAVAPSRCNRGAGALLPGAAPGGGPPGSQARVLGYAVDVAAALKYLHRNGIVHADLKSANVLLGEGRDRKPVAKLADFGMARIVRDTQGGSVAASSMGGGGARGTVGWMAPEVMSGEKASRAADLYAFGMVVWELLTGDTPFAGMHMMAVGRAVIDRRERPALPAQCPPALAGLVRALWAADPGARPDASEALAAVTELRGAR